MRATLIAAGTAAVLWALRIKTPAVRHVAWTAVLLAMLFLPLWSLAGLKLSVPVLPATLEAPAAAPGAVTKTPQVVDAPLTVTTAPPSPVAPTESSRQIEWQLVLLAVYMTGVMVLLVRLGFGTVQAQLLRRSAVTKAGRSASDLCTTPITVGFLRPALILPASWPQWSSAQLQAVLTHENEHARRRDPLVQWLALFNRAVFWFHPLAWWLERRLATLAEESCDAAVLAAGNSPQDYSEYLLEMARQVTHQGRRVRTVGMAMPGSGLKPRLKQILDGLPVAPTSRARMICTISLCAISSVLFTTGTLARQTPAVATSAQESFDVVSIKPCASVESAETGRGAGPNLAQVSPGHAYWACVTVASLVDQAYAGADFPLLNVSARPLAFGERRGAERDSTRVRGGPGWINSDRFAIEVTASVDTINGRGNLLRLPPSMNRALRAMLADRFQLKVRRATEEQPMYALTVAPGGLKIKAPAPGDCTVWSAGMPRSPQRGEKSYCGNLAHTTPRAKLARLEAGDDPATVEAMPGPNRRLEYSGVTLAEVAKDLATVMDRYVLDKTSVGGEFMFAVEFSADENTPGFGGRSAASASGPRIFQALEPLGLKLEPIKGPAEYLAIDSVQRPRPDAPIEISEPPARASGPFVTAESDQTTSSGRTFDVASIKPCTNIPAALVSRRGGLKTIGNTSNRLFLDCISLESLVDLAYNRDGDFVLNEHIEREVRGGPDWVKSERFTIEATTPGAPEANALMGSMLRALLEDRFQLRVHRESDEIPMYALTVAKSGLKIKPMAPGDCSDDDPANQTVPNPAMFAAGKKRPCGGVRGQMRGTVRVWDLVGVSMQSLADLLDTDRKVLDQTGVTGDFLIHLEYERDEKLLDGVNVFAALEAQLGLKLVSTKGPHTFTVIDRVERPRPDAPVESAIASTRPPSWTLR